METAACVNLKAVCCVVVEEPRAAFELASEDREGSPEAGMPKQK